MESLSDMSPARSERSMQRDATLISAQRVVASASEARAAERDRHLTDLEEYRSGKNKSDVRRRSQQSSFMFTHDGTLRMRTESVFDMTVTHGDLRRLREAGVECR